MTGVGEILVLIFLIQNKKMYRKRVCHRNNGGKKTYKKHPGHN